jgi:hypothetical protein
MFRVQEVLAIRTLIFAAAAALALFAVPAQAQTCYRLGDTIRCNDGSSITNDGFGTYRIRPPSAQGGGPGMMRGFQGGLGMLGTLEELQYRQRQMELLEHRQREAAAPPATSTRAGCPPGPDGYPVCPSGVSVTPTPPGCAKTEPNTFTCP